MYYLEARFLANCSREAKTKFRQCDWSAKKFAAKKLDSSYSFTCRFARTNSPSGKRHSGDCHSTTLLNIC